MSKNNPHWGTTLGDFLAEDGIREAAKAEAVTRVVAWQLSQEMERLGITKVATTDKHAPAPHPSASPGRCRTDVSSP
jgi:hypothetical protein